jgi:sucrose phosphorylase
MIEKLVKLYGEEATDVHKAVIDLMQRFSKPKSKKRVGITEKDSILITYGDSLQEKGQKPLKTLKKFLEEDVKDAIQGVHILPFYPYSSDDGFSVISYKEVDPRLGNWEDIKAISLNHDLMMDGVINHISKESDCFSRYLKGDQAFENFFIECDPKADYSKVVRPRALPLLTAFQVKGETKYIWTTFSDDQIDLNYQNPQVFLYIIEVLIGYVEKGARFIRLDAIGFAWKELGTFCIHHEKTHVLVQLIREILVHINPEVVIVTETNVPHHENISYFGDGHNEAHMVYQFPLPPLTLHTLIAGDSRKITAWAKSLERLSDETTFFNFLASHDGIGVRPVEQLLSTKEIETLVKKVELNGGRISYKDNGDGTLSPYELNINYMDALGVYEVDEETLIKKFMAAMGILYTFIGVPGIYIHSLLGSGNDEKGVDQSGINRRINREKLDYSQCKKEIQRDGRRKQVFEKNLELLRIRKKEKSFHPHGFQEVMEEDSRLLIIRRWDPKKTESILALINVSNEKVAYKAKGFDLIHKTTISDIISLDPYDMAWIKE